MLPVYCPHLAINKPEVLHTQGPILFAANHPNSFLDGVILTTLLQYKLYSLARGDAFQPKRIGRLLRGIHLLPVYRTSEGVENLEHNYSTFKECIEAFQKQHLVLIFSEGRCENEWHLRPLRKGTARLALSAWQQGIPLAVIPLAFNYSSFKKFGKALHLNFGTPILQSHIDSKAAEGRQNLAFNNLLHQQLRTMVYEIDEKDQKRHRQFFVRKRGAAFYACLLPGLAGLLLNGPLLALCTGLTRLKFAKSGHYDSVQTALFLLLYPFYAAVVSICFGLVVGWPAVVVPIVMYTTALAWVRVRYALIG